MDTGQIEPISAAVKQAQMEEISALATALVRAGAEVNAKSYNGSTALIMAADKGHSEAVEELVKATDILLDCKSSYSERTALQLAAHRGHARVVELLVRAGADLNTCNRALMKAAEGGKVDMIRILLEANARTPAPVGRSRVV
jgi:ankyrin repeat protein